MIISKFLDPIFIASLPKSRVEAKVTGSPHYIGRPCIAGHVVRLTSTKVCCQCARERQQTPEGKAALAACQAVRNLRPEVKAAKATYDAARSARPEVKAANTVRRSRPDVIQAQIARIAARRLIDPYFDANYYTSTTLAHACVSIRDYDFNRDYILLEPRVHPHFWFTQGELHDHLLHLGMVWSRYGNSRTGGDMGVDHFLPLGLIVENCPQEIIEMILSLDNLRPLLRSENLGYKARQDKKLIANFKLLIAQQASLEEFLAILPLSQSMAIAA